MNLSTALISTPWYWLGHAVVWPALLLAAWRADWRRIQDPGDSHVLFAAVLIVWLMWRMSISLNHAPGLEFHVLLATSATLMFGWPFALFCVSLAQALLSLEGRAAWDGYAVNVLCNGFTPIFITVLIHRASARWLPRHFFIYIYASAFLAGGLGMLASRLLGMIVLISSGAYALEQLHSEYVSILPIMLFPEAFLNGAIMTLLVAFQPSWVSSFQDKEYLHGK